MGRSWPAVQKANKTLPQIEKILAEAAKVDAAEDAQRGDNPPAATPRPLAMRAGRAERLAAARDRLAAEDQERRDAQRPSRKPLTRLKHACRQRPLFGM
jgi:hypothetical protein